MKKRIISITLIIAMLFSLCGCSLDNLKSEVENKKSTWFSTLESKVANLSQNWFSNLKSSAENFGSYTFADLTRETENFTKLDFETTYVAYEDELHKALKNKSSDDVIVVQKHITITKDLVIPKNKHVIFQNGVIFTIPTTLGITIENNASLSFAGVSYLVINELGSCTIENGGTLNIGEDAGFLLASSEDLTMGETANLENHGMLQQGTTFTAYSTHGIETAIRSSQDGGTIILSEGVFGSESDYKIYNIDKSISISGTEETNKETGEKSLKTTIYGGFVVVSDNVSISSVEIFTPEKSSNITTSKTLAEGYTPTAGITVVSSSATITNNIIHCGKEGTNAIEIYPYQSEEETQSYDIKSNTFTGFGTTSSHATAPIVAREYNSDVAKFGKTIASGEFNISDAQKTALLKNNTFENCNLFATVLNYSDGENIQTIITKGKDITQDFTFDNNYYITENCTITNAVITIPENVTITVATGAKISMDEVSTMNIAETSKIILQSGGAFETFGVVTGNVEGAGNFIDWPNYLDFTIKTLDEYGNWQTDLTLGEYKGYTESKLNMMYCAQKQAKGDNYIIGYNVEFYLNPDDVYPLQKDHVFKEDTTLYAKFEGKSIPVFFDDNGGNGIGANRGEITYPREIFLDNATTSKSGKFFGGWKIVGGAFDGEFVAVIDDLFILELYQKGYTSLNLQATWIETNKLSSYSKVYYLTNGSQYDKNCDVHVYSLTGDGTASYNPDKFDYEDGEISLIKLKDGEGYYKNAYIFFDIEEGYELSSVIVTNNFTKTDYNMTNEAIINSDKGLPLVFPQEASITIEVKTQKISDKIQEIASVGIAKNDAIVYQTNFNNMSFAYNDIIKFTAKTPDNDIVSNFYVKMTLTKTTGKKETFIYYNPTGISWDDEFAGGKVTFEIFAVDGRSKLSKDFEFSHTFSIAKKPTGLK